MELGTFKETRDSYHKFHRDMELSKVKSPEHQLLCEVIWSGIDTRDKAFLESDRCKWYCNLIGLHYRHIQTLIPKLVKKQPICRAEKLTMDDAKAIRECINITTPLQLAEKYKVSKQNIKAIFRNKIWVDSNYLAHYYCVSCRVWKLLNEFDVSDRRSTCVQCISGNCPHREGEMNPRSRLTEEKVKEIIKLKGKKSGHEVAKIYAVHFSTIYSIWKKRIWGYLND